MDAVGDSRARGRQDFFSSVLAGAASGRIELPVQKRRNRFLTTWAILVASVPQEQKMGAFAEHLGATHPSVILALNLSVLLYRPMHGSRCLTTWALLVPQIPQGQTKGNRFLTTCALLVPV